MDGVHLKAHVALLAQIIFMTRDWAELEQREGRPVGPNGDPYLWALVAWLGKMGGEMIEKGHVLLADHPVPPSLLQHAREMGNGGATN